VPSLVWCPPGWCCGNLYLVADRQAWRCPFSGVRARTVVAEFDGLAWSKPRTMRRFFVQHRDNLRHLADAFGGDGLEKLLDPVGKAGDRKQGKPICDLIRCVVGNPFRPLLPISPAVLAWNGGTVRHLAERIGAGRAFDRLPVLADALEEAGCTDAELLAHCRGPGPHQRGCHVLDLLMEDSRCGPVS
jgi:hypothetical protein